MARPRKSATPRGASARTRTLINVTKAAIEQGAKPKRKKTGGRVAGTPNAATAAKDIALNQAFLEACSTLTKEQLEKPDPFIIMERALAASVKIGDWSSSVMVSKELAPYYRAKKAPVPDDLGDDNKVVIEGGLPKRKL